VLSRSNNDDSNTAATPDKGRSPNGRLAPSSLRVPPVPYGEWITEPLLLVALGPKGQEIARARLDLHGLLDERFFFGGPLGVIWNGTQAELTLWAPTAQLVKAILFDENGNPFRVLPMQKEGGVWRTSATPGTRYLFEVTVFQPETGQVETHRVTDPWGVALTPGSRFSLAVDLDSPDMKPAGWSSFVPPAHGAPVSVYETHVRDLTVADPDLTTRLRGKFEGMAAPGSRHEAHLRNLAGAGITHLHLLPLNDFGSVPEEAQEEPRVPASGRSSAAPQEEIDRVRKSDAYNWGYDPVHWLVPEGSYAVENRTKELRALVMRLGSMGLGLVQDVVFNHTYASGTEPFSVLDRVVPMYFHRFRADGTRFESSCCPDTASERRMMEKLITDSLLHWARAYRVAGFRFDLMNLHPKKMMERIRDRLRKEFPGILLYGEAWPFGSLEETLPGQAFFQTRSHGTGVASFNDRFRDALRGGNTSPSGKSDQGWATGLFWNFNHEPANRDTPPSASAQAERLAFYSDVIRFGLSGSLRDFTLRDFHGNAVKGGEHFFRGQPTAWAQSPGETVNYASAHDGYTLFDALAAKLPFAEPTRLSLPRAQLLALATVALSQGIAFFEGGSELLRSKSGDADSYDSGDWFNRLDFTYTDNGFGSGLPIADKNQDNWPLQAPLLGNPDLKPTQENILAAVAHFQETLQIRKSSPLFRLQTADEINARLTFQNTGPDQIPGLIVMTLADEDDKGVPAGDLDPNYDRIVVLFNAAPGEVSFAIPEDAGLELGEMQFRLHPILAASADPVVQTSSYDAATGTFTVPGRTTAVFVLDEIPVQLELPTAEPAPTRVPTSTPESTPALSEETETPTNTYIVGALIGLVVVFGLAAWARMRKGKK
ncbi:MAG: DUF3372 domain-containing protein, partial [Anaerolineales bacterium]|nr:DUF3372 domain-containing protein [Anaerolineales bacterium]